MTYKRFFGVLEILEVQRKGGREERGNLREKPGKSSRLNGLF